MVYSMHIITNNFGIFKTIDKQNNRNNRPLSATRPTLLEICIAGTEKAPRFISQMQTYQQRLKKNKLCIFL